MLLIPPILLKSTSFFFSLIWVYATSFSLGSNMTGGLTLKGKSSKPIGYNILFTLSMKRTFCDANKVRLRTADRTIGLIQMFFLWRFEFCLSFWGIHKIDLLSYWWWSGFCSSSISKISQTWHFCLLLFKGTNKTFFSIYLIGFLIYSKFFQWFSLHTRHVLSQIYVWIVWEKNFPVNAENGKSV